MSAVWDMALPPSEKLVLLAMADWARDDGRCWPSIKMLADKSGVSERTVQRMLREAEKAGLIERVENVGKGCEYRFKGRHHVTPDKMTPATYDVETPDKVSPNTLVTVIIDEREQRGRAILALPQWKAFKAMRRDIKKPVNATAERRLLSKLIGLADAGYPPGEVLDQSTEHCWQGVFKIEDRDDGRQADRRSNGRMGGPRTDPTLALVRAANAAIARGGEDHGEPRLALPSSQFG